MGSEEREWVTGEIEAMFQVYPCDRHHTAVQGLGARAMARRQRAVRRRFLRASVAAVRANLRRQVGAAGYSSGLEFRDELVRGLDHAGEAADAELVDRDEDADPA